MSFIASPVRRHYLGATSRPGLDPLRASSALLAATPVAEPPEKRWNQAAECAGKFAKNNPGGSHMNMHVRQGVDSSIRAVAALAFLFGILGSPNSGAARPEAVGDG